MARRGGFVFRQAQLRGLLGGSRPWTYLWMFLVAKRILRRVTRDEPEVVYRSELEPGETIVVSSADREPRIIGG